jgi:hypothetical protein
VPLLPPVDAAGAFGFARGRAGGVGGVVFCRDFQRGSCHRDKCRYTHATAAEESEYLSTGKLPATSVPAGGYADSVDTRARSRSPRRYSRSPARRSRSRSPVRRSRSRSPARRASRSPPPRSRDPSPRDRSPLEATAKRRTPSPAGEQ